MKSWVLRFGLPTLLGAFLLVPATYASTITVLNPSFEQLPSGGLTNTCGTGCSFGPGVPGWTTTGADGEFRPGAPTNKTIFNTIPDGTTIAYSNGGTTSQIVTPTVVAGEIYTLTVDVGVRKGGSDPGSEALVINGHTYLATGTLPVGGNWATFTATYTGKAADVGKSIEILLSSPGVQADWDNVKLSGVPGSDVPETTTSLLLGTGLALLGLVARRKRRAA